MRLSSVLAFAAGAVALPLVARQATDAAGTTTVASGDGDGPRPFSWLIRRGDEAANADDAFYFLRRDTNEVDFDWLLRRGNEATDAEDAFYFLRRGEESADAEDAFYFLRRGEEAVDAEDAFYFLRRN